jgi:hypothetical protein
MRLGRAFLFRRSDLQVRHKASPDSALAAEENFSRLALQLGRTRLVYAAFAAFLCFVPFTPTLRADYVVLRSGQRLNVTGYQLVGEKYHLQLAGGFVEVAAEEVVSIEPEEIFTSEPKKAEPAIAGPYGEFITAAAAKYKVDADLITSVIATESNFDPKAISRRNARGLMQLMPQTAAHLGVQNIFDPKENIDGGTHYLRDLLQRYNNDLILALAAYNAGPERVVTTVPRIRETKNYVARVKRNLDQRKSDQHKSDQHKSAGPMGISPTPDASALLPNALLTSPNVVPPARREAKPATAPADRPGAVQ